MAKTLGVSRCGYYSFLSQEPSKRKLENEQLFQEIKKVHEANRKTYGSPRVQAELKKRGIKCSRKRVARLMRQEGVQAKMRKKWKVTTRIGKTAKVVAPNHLDQQFTVEAPNKVWVSDITYVPTEEGWLYVATVMDLFSRKVVGVNMEDRLETKLVLKAIKQALNNRGINEGLLHHSDRGSQYTNSDSQHLSSIFLLALHTGMRKGELLSLRWSNIDLKNKEILLLRSKNGEPRDIPMTESVQDLLSNLSLSQTRKGEDLLFPSPFNPQKPIDIRTAWERILKLGKITGATFHTIRHTTCSLLASLGLPSILIARFAGHKNSKTTDIYTHAVKDSQHEAAKKLGFVLTRSKA